MKKQLIFLAIIGLIFIKLNAQDMNTFKRELSSLQLQYSQLFIKSSTLDQLELGAENINSGVRSLKDKVQNYVKREKLARVQEWKSLLDEIEEFYSFSAFGRPVCECLSYFGSFMDKLNASGRILSEQHGLRIVEATIGNFKAYYIYGQHDWHYDLKVTMNLNQNDRRSRVENSFGLWGGVEILFYAPKNENWTVNKIELLGTTQNIYRTINCNEPIPRF